MFGASLIFGHKASKKLCVKLGVKPERGWQFAFTILGKTIVSPTIPIQNGKK